MTLIIALLQKEYLRTMQASEEWECNAPHCVLTVRHAGTSVGSVVKFKVVLLPADRSTGQVYHNISQGPSIIKKQKLQWLQSGLLGQPLRPPHPPKAAT